jgi:phage terminase small subunit
MEKLLKIKLTKEELDISEAAAIEAGYSPKSARRTGARLLRTPKIRRAIERRLAELGRQE